MAWVLLNGCSHATTPTTTAPCAIRSTDRSSASASAWLETPLEAFDEGKRRGQWVLADLWAPWCHTCLSMKTHVLRLDVVPELASFVLLSVDTEQASNEAFLAEYSIGVWPTFYLLDPLTREVRGRWLGAATRAQLSQWLKNSLREHPGAEQLAREADALAATKAWAPAEARYVAALAAAPGSWERRPATLVSLILVLSKQKHEAACLQLAFTELPSIPPSVSAVDFAATALGCADRDAHNPNATKVRAIAESTLARDCNTAAPGVATDDRADACDNLRRVREALGDREGAAKAALQALAAIATASAGAPPERQAIYDWQRTASLVYLGRAREAEALLLEREQQLPQSYNPPHYLARLYRDSQRWREGLAAIDHALALAYGPRRVALLGIKADLLTGAGQREGARQVLELQLESYRALPAGQRQPEAEIAVQTRLEEWKRRWRSSSSR